jgi:predicted DNA-binding ribbon-helix-helix protein
MGRTVTTPARAVRIDSATWDALRARAAAEGVTVSDLVREGVAAVLARQPVPTG